MTLACNVRSTCQRTISRVTGEVESRCPVSAFTRLIIYTVAPLSEYEVKLQENESSAYSKCREPGSRPVWKK
jgi:hypothetical protein